MWRHRNLRGESDDISVRSLPSDTTGLEEARAGPIDSDSERRPRMAGRRSRRARSDPHNGSVPPDLRCQQTDIRTGTHDLHCRSWRTLRNPRPHRSDPPTAPHPNYPRRLARSPTQHLSPLRTPPPTPSHSHPDRRQGHPNELHRSLGTQRLPREPPPPPSSLGRADESSSAVKRPRRTGRVIVDRAARPLRTRRRRCLFASRES